MSPSKLWEGWQAPEELNRALPRPVRLTGTGIWICLISAFLVGGGGYGGVSVAGDCLRQRAEVQRMLVEGREAEGVVTRLVETHGRGPHFHVHYQYSVHGQVFDDSTHVREEHWRDLRVGTPIAVRYLPSDPGRNFPSGEPPHILPLWFPVLWVPLSSGVAALLLLGVLRARRYLAYGRPAPALVTRAVKRPAGRSGTEVAFDYEFPLMQGGACHGSDTTSSEPLPSEGSVICVLYEPDNPRRHVIYPIKLLKVATS